MLYTFAVGPSQVYPQVAGFYQEAFAQGFPSESHRGKAFMGIYEQAVSGIRQKLNVPEDYKIFFTCSATECWEMLSQAYAKEGAYHAFSGSFGEKWLETGKAVAANSQSFRFDINSDPFALLESMPDRVGLIALTLNETSNATALPFDLLKKASEARPGAITAIDTTSIMAGVNMPWYSADAWFASVQKCFGLPSGLAVMVLSPKAVQHAQSADDTRYNSIASHLKFAEINQTPFTPNMLAIYSMAKLMDTLPPIADIEARILKRAAKLYAWLDACAHLEPLITRQENRSPTVIAAKVPAEKLAVYQQAAIKAGFELGRGYGAWRETTFRIANFPAVDDAHLESLMRVLDAVE